MLKIKKMHKKIEKMKKNRIFLRKNLQMSFFFIIFALFFEIEPKTTTKNNQKFTNYEQVLQHKMF